MARKSRKYVIEQTKDNVFRVAGYIRLSSIKSYESNAFAESQKLIIENFIKERPDMILEKFYIDENVSDSIFKRDAFEEMIEDIESGKINCVVCKDLSRFSRNMLGTGYYIEKYFTQHEIRFIAINNEFDTNNDIYESDEHGNLKKDFRIQSMLDEAVTYDISTKVSRNLNELAKQGLFVAPRASFDYKKVNKHKLGIRPYGSTCSETNL